MQIEALLPKKEEIEKIISRSVDELPVFPAMATRLLDTTSDEKFSASDVAEIVELDISISAKVLKIINSAAYGYFSEITSVEQAVVLLGVSEIREFLRGHRNRVAGCRRWLAAVPNRALWRGPDVVIDSGHHRAPATISDAQRIRR